MEKVKGVNFGVFTLIATVQLIMATLQEEEGEDSGLGYLMKIVCGP